jgi:hypothetical protein
LYLAENPSVAREYQEKLSSTGGAKHLAAQFGDVEKGLSEAARRIEHYKQLIANGGGGDMRRANSMLNIAQKNHDDLAAMKSGLPENTGALYKVDLPDDQIARMLDWDKPLSQQPVNVQEAWNALGKEWGIPINQSEMIGNTMNRAMLENEMQKRGVPGVRYLDGGSRGAGQGTSNYVIFPGNEGLLTILERNGMATNGLLGGK